MRTLAITLALSTASCGFAVKHPAATAAIVGGTLGGLTCEIGTDFGDHAACGITTLGAAALLGGVVLIATALGGDGNTVLHGAPMELEGEPPPSIDDGPSGELPPGVEPVPPSEPPPPTTTPTTPAPTTPAPTTPAPTTPAPTTPAPTTPAPTTP